MSRLLGLSDTFAVLNGKNHFRHAFIVIQDMVGKPVGQKSDRILHNLIIVFATLPAPEINDM
ncbi:MAG: hypothetical protein AB2672_20905 [Candidatus Thiodiazotropha endolucinida]|nr:hypothetical protein [Candidatus Thiodiazotropha taylori]MCW4224851.1 hypothetical protein [Candidatus Thiodiazotropha endolucinida]MCG7886424.1 hypothetical protein [Candidatus Thiodiazotropha taylori]MCG7888942.1 hypothetical protein [Candidatus Thiodiazotropha taylori]MCG7952275.1 hypothetical protein [Candidatus Thiodiazotropha taylori]